LKTLKISTSAGIKQEKSFNINQSGDKWHIIISTKDSQKRNEDTLFKMELLKLVEDEKILKDTIEFTMKHS